MDDSASHFFILVAWICESSQLASLPVALVLADGERLEGEPHVTPATGDDELDETGYTNTVDVGHRRVPLAEVVEIHVRRSPCPGGAPDRPHATAAVSG